MDPQMMQRILQRQGAPDTPANQNSVAQFAAANPDVLDRYGMNLPPGLDDNSALLKLALERSMASVDGVQPAGAQGAGPAGAFTPQEARGMANIPSTSQPVPQRQGAPAQPGVPQKSIGGSKQQTQYGEGTGEQLSPLSGYDWRADKANVLPPGVTVGGAPSGLGAAHGTDIPGSGTFTANGPGATGPQSGSLMDWLLPTIGGAALAGGAWAARPKGNAPAPPVAAPQGASPKQLTYQPEQKPPIAMPDQSGPGGKPGQSAADIERMKGEVAAENEQSARAFQEQMRKRNAQSETADLARRAGRAVGRK